MVKSGLQTIRGLFSRTEEVPDFAEKEAMREYWVAYDRRVDQEEKDLKKEIEEVKFKLDLSIGDAIRPSIPKHEGQPGIV